MSLTVCNKENINEVNPTLNGKQVMTGSSFLFLIVYTHLYDQARGIIPTTMQAYYIYTAAYI